MPRVVHFELAADNPERAVKFYRDVFEWRIEKWSGQEDYWLVTTGDPKEPGIDGGIMRRTDPRATTINSVDVPSVDEFAGKVTRAGGKIVLPKTAIPGVGYLIYCQDTEGNTFGLYQDDRSAK